MAEVTKKGRVERFTKAGIFEGNMRQCDTCKTANKTESVAFERLNT